MKAAPRTSGTKRRATTTTCPTCLFTDFGWQPEVDGDNNSYHHTDDDNNNDDIQRQPNTLGQWRLPATCVNTVARVGRLEDGRSPRELAASGTEDRRPCVRRGKHSLGLLLRRPCPLHGEAKLKVTRRITAVAYLGGGIDPWPPLNIWIFFVCDLLRQYVVDGHLIQGRS